MLWLQPIPWVRWSAALAIAAIAAWVELAPDGVSEHVFATVDIPRGETLTSANTETREIPSGLLPQPGAGSVAARDISAGSPLGPEDTAEPGAVVPSGWWVTTTDLPAGAQRGDPVRIVLLDTGAAVDGVVSSTETGDPFAVGQGAVAIPPEHASDVARALSDGRMVVLVGTG